MFRDSKEAIEQNLKDAGCSRAQIDRFMECAQKGALQEELQLLAGHRETLLRSMHAAQKRIDCLDYLVYTLQKAQSAK